MITKQQYVEYLLATPGNYTCSYLAHHLEGVSHDAVSDYLRRERHTACELWKLARSLIDDGPEAYLIADDSVQNKQYSEKIELVRRQYSGNEHGLVRGIGIVNLVHTSGLEGDFYPIDFRIYAPEQDGKTKNEHFREMLLRAFTDKGLKAHTVLFDSWYASVDNLKLVHRAGRVFFTTLKSNRLVSLSKESGYVHLEEVAWSQERLLHGVRVKLKEVPFHVQLFKLVAPDGDIDWVVTNKLELDGPDETLTASLVQKENEVRWQVEELHRGLKQLCGAEKCQCRKARAQRNHMACSYHAWLTLKVKATELRTTLYQVRGGLFGDYLREELRHPRIPALMPT